MTDYKKKLLCWRTWIGKVSLGNAVLFPPFPGGTARGAAIVWLAAHGLSLVGIVTVLEHMPMSTAAYGAVPRIAIGPKLPGRMYTSVVIRKKKTEKPMTANTKDYNMR